MINQFFSDNSSQNETLYIAVDELALSIPLKSQYTTISM